MSAAGVAGAGASIGGTILGAIGSEREASAKRQAAARNQAFFAEQAKFNKFVGRRKVDIFKRESELFFGDQVSRFAKAGVDISGSPLLQLTQTKVFAAQELRAIRKENAFNLRLAQLQADGAAAEARFARRSRGLNLATTILGGISGTARAASIGGGG